MENNIYTLSIYTENKVGIVNRISAMFLRRKINLESFISSESEIKDVYRHVIVVNVTEQQIKRLVLQIQKQIDVIKVYYHTDNEIIYIESALFKIKTELLFENRQIQNIIKQSNANIVTVSRDFFVIQKSGRVSEIQELYDTLYPYGIMQYIKSGRINISKSKMNITELLTKISN